MSRVFRLIEGIVNIRPTKVLGDFVTDGPQAVAADVAFDFGAIRKDIHVECDQPVTVKFNSAANAGMTVPAGSWDWTDEFANKAFVTFTAPTDFRMQANG